MPLVPVTDGDAASGPHGSLLVPSSPTPGDPGKKVREHLSDDGDVFVQAPIISAVPVPYLDDRGAEDVDEKPTENPSVPRSFAPGDLSTGAAEDEAAQPEHTQKSLDKKVQIDGPEVAIPRSARRLYPVPRPPISEAVRRETRSAGLNPRPIDNSFSSWQMPFPGKLPSGVRCPISMLGECGDKNCPTFRPKYPEVREAIEASVVRKCVDYFRLNNSLHTYVSVGCGLLSQDWIVLEKLREAGLRPCRLIFVELRASSPVLALEGHSNFCTGRLDLHQTGFDRVFGPEFSFAAEIRFDEATRGGMIFDFCNGPGQDAIFAEVPGPDAPGYLIFGVCKGDESKVLHVEKAWNAGECHAYLFTVSATGTLRVYVNGQEKARGYGHKPEPVERRHMYVGGASDSDDNNFQGMIMKIKIWDHEVDAYSAVSLYQGEMNMALEQFVQWHAEDAAVWTFGSIATYTEAAEKDSRFAADLLLRIDVHDEIDGYDDFACKALSSYGLALTLGGPGSSWCRCGGGFRPVTDAKVGILDKAERVAHMPPAYRKKAENLSYFLAPDAVCRIPDMWPARRRTPVVEVRKKKGTRRRRRQDAAAIEITRASGIEHGCSPDTPDLAAPRVRHTISMTAPKRLSRVAGSEAADTDKVRKHVPVVTDEDSDLDDEDRMAIAEVQKKGYHQGRPASQITAPPRCLDLIVGDTDKATSLPVASQSGDLARPDEACKGLLSPPTQAAEASAQRPKCHARSAHLAQATDVSMPKGKQPERCGSARAIREAHLQSRTKKSAEPEPVLDITTEDTFPNLEDLLSELDD